jgi:hypothetical protein
MRGICKINDLFSRFMLLLLYDLSEIKLHRNMYLKFIFNNYSADITSKSICKYHLLRYSLKKKKIYKEVSVKHSKVMFVLFYFP